MVSLEGLISFFPFTFLILRVQCVEYPRTIYDFASAKLEKKNETAKKERSKSRRGGNNKET